MVDQGVFAYETQAQGSRAATIQEFMNDPIKQ